MEANVNKIKSPVWLRILAGLSMIFAMSFVLYKFIGWFINPIFIDLPLVSYIQSIGLILLSKLILAKVPENKLEVSTIDTSIAVIIAPWMLLLIGFIVHLFI